MRNLILLAALPLVAAAAAPEGTPLPEWLAGAWCTEGGEEITCEYWTAPAGGMMLGASQSVKHGKTTSFEHLRIRLEEGVPVYYAQPGGRPATGFRGVESGALSVTFENRAHDYPQRIRYSLDGDVLTAEIALADGGNAMQWRYVRRK